MDNLQLAPALRILWAREFGMPANGLLAKMRDVVFGDESRPGRVRRGINIPLANGKGQAQVTRGQIAWNTTKTALYRLSTIKQARRRQHGMSLPGSNLS